MKWCNLIAFAGGALAGGAIALMFAPKRGEEMRGDVKKKMCSLKKHIDNIVADYAGSERVDVTIEK